jgi:hypothetical protein
MKAGDFKVLRFPEWQKKASASQATHKKENKMKRTVFILLEDWNKSDLILGVFATRRLARKWASKCDPRGDYKVIEAKIKYPSERKSK